MTNGIILIFYPLKIPMCSDSLNQKKKILEIKLVTLLKIVIKVNAKEQRRYDALLSNFLRMYVTCLRVYS